MVITIAIVIVIVIAIRAVFIVVASLITRGSKIKVINVLYDSMRLKVFKILMKMGAKIKINKTASERCEIISEYSNIKNINLNVNDVTPLIDEFPALSIAAACGKGKMIMKGLGELRYKESDRFKSISEGLRNAGVQVNTFNDDMEIIGTRKVLGGNTIVAENEADLKARKISVDSPIGKGLLGKSVGDIADIQTPSGIMKFEVISIER